MPLQMDRDVRRVTVLRGSGGRGRPQRVIYSREGGFEEYETDRSDNPRLIAILRHTRSGRLVSRELYEGSRRRRQKGVLGSVSRFLERGAEFQVRALRNYVGRHRISNEERRGGWLPDLRRNAVKSIRKARPRRIMRNDD